MPIKEGNSNQKGGNTRKILVKTFFSKVRDKDYPNFGLQDNEGNYYTNLWTAKSDLGNKLKKMFKKNPNENKGFRVEFVKPYPEIEVSYDVEGDFKHLKGTEPINLNLEGCEWNSKKEKLVGEKAPEFEEDSKETTVEEGNEEFISFATTTNHIFSDVWSKLTEEKKEEIAKKEEFQEFRNELKEILNA